MLKKLEELDEKSGKKKTPENQARDILIALTCMKNCLTLVTNDNNLKKVAQDFQCSAITFEQLLKGEYREFKDTEIGRIPKEWGVVKLKNLFTYIKGKKPEEITEEYKGNYLPYLSTEYLRENEITKFVKPSQNTILVNEGDLILLWDGSNAGEFFLGKRGVLSSTMVKIKQKEQKYNQNFLFYLLKTKESFLKKHTRGTGIPHVDGAVLNSIIIPCPSLLEQEKIAEFLSTVDKKLEIERNEKAKLEKIKQAMMDLLLTGKIRVKVN
jgi:type I restriction enzyme S subunit